MRWFMRSELKSRIRFANTRLHVGQGGEIAQNELVAFCQDRGRREDCEGA